MASSSTYTTVQALLAAYATGQRDFANISLPEANLNGAKLKGADFSYADFSDSDLGGAQLRGADLSYARLSGANLASADLRGAMLIGTDLRECNLAGALLESADYDPHETHFPAGFDPIAADMKADQ